MANDIEQAVVFYLENHPTFSPLVQGVYFNQAPIEAIQPYVVVTNSGGMTKKITLDKYSDTKDTLSIYIDDPDSVHGNELAKALVLTLRNYRGNFPPPSYNCPVTLLDSQIRVGTPRDLIGFQGTFRSLITAYVWYLEITTQPDSES